MISVSAASVKEDVLVSKELEIVMLGRELVSGSTDFSFLEEWSMKKYAVNTGYTRLL